MLTFLEHHQSEMRAVKPCKLPESVDELIIMTNYGLSLFLGKNSDKTGGQMVNEDFLAGLFSALIGFTDEMGFGDMQTLKMKKKQVNFTTYQFEKAEEKQKGTVVKALIFIALSNRT